MNRPAEEDFHAYVDGTLVTEERARVEAWLLNHSDDAETVRQWQVQAEGLRQIFAPVTSESIPERLLRPVRQTPVFAWRVAAAIAWLSVGTGLGYGLHSTQSKGDSELVTLVRPAAVAHVVFSPEVRHPVEVGSDQEAHLAQWLSKRLGTTVLAPHLQSAGFHLLGGRLLPGEGSAAAQFMYEDGTGRRVTLYVRREVSSNRDTAFRFARENGLSVFYWVDGQAAYALSADLPREILLGLAELAYRDLEGQTTAH